MAVLDPTTVVPRAVDDRVPPRAVLIGLAVAFLGVFVLLMSGPDVSEDASLAEAKNAYDISSAHLYLMVFALAAGAGLLGILGGALRQAVRGNTRSWAADAGMLGFVALGAGFAAMDAVGLAMWHAVDHGDDTAVQALKYLDAAGFLFVLPGLLCAMVGVGLAGLRSGALPTWLAVASIVLGLAAPLGPGGFAPFLALPLWLLAVAVTVRLPRT